MNQFPALLAICLLSFLKLSSQGYTITRYDVGMILNKDGSVDISEDIDVFFTDKRRGIMRDIPRKIIINDSIERNVNVSGVNTDGETFKMLNRGNNRTIRLGEEDKWITGPKSYHLEYTLSSFAIYEEDHIAFQYNIIGGWDTSIDTVIYSLELPEELDLRYNNYRVITGALGENNRAAKIEKAGNIISGHSLRPLEPGEYITIFIKLPAEYLLKPPPPVPIYRKDKFWVLPAAMLIWIIGFFRSKSRIDVEDIGEQYFPPDGLSPAEVGSYWDNKVHTEDIISLLPYWADKGYIKIMGSGAGDASDLFFKRINELPADAPEYQKTIFNTIFQQEDLVILSELKNKVYNSMYKASSQIRKRLRSRELYDENNYRIFHSGLLIIASLILIIAALPLFIFGYILTAAVSIALAIVCIVIHFQSPKRSRKGALIQSQLLALKKFLEEGSGQKSYDLMQTYPGYFEKLLPYAIAFGLDKSWFGKLESFDIDPPYWYMLHHPDGIRPGQPDFNHFRSTFDVPQMKSVFTSKPAPSGNSLSSGGSYSGGSAGGGFGGGGSSW